MKTWHALSESEIFKILETSKEGLSEEEAKRRLLKNGFNEIVRTKKRTAAEIFVSQFKSFLIILLLVATVISFILGELIDGIVILAVVIINTAMGFFQEYSAEKAVEALEKLTTPTSFVIRNGIKKEIPAKEIVPGDIVYLEEGVRVPADLRIIEQNELRIDESSVTGESIPVSKKVCVLKKEVALADMINMAFMGTYVTSGVGYGVVVDTGMDTVLGQIAKEVAETKSPATPLQIKLEELGRYLGIIVLIAAALIFVLGIYLKQGSLFEMFLVAVALAISAVPEGLPTIVTLTLSLGVRRAANRKAIVRKLTAVETLGTVSVICADKTGTLTKNEMTVEQIYTDGKFFSVSGKGYVPEGQFLFNNKKIEPLKNKTLSLLIKTMAICNNANLEQLYGVWNVVGDPTEGALIVLAEKAGIKYNTLKEYKRKKEISFTSERKMMSVLCSFGKQDFVFSKGAPEQIISKCKYIQTEKGVKKLTKSDAEEIIEIAKSMASKPLRVLAGAYKILKSKQEDIESDLIFLGIVGMEDPIREGVKEAIKKARDAGIKTVMITGDHQLTAEAVAKQLGLINEKEKIITGIELESMSQTELENIIENVSVFARVSPEHKVRILEAFQKKGYVVAMTGDGVNDAPAIKKADIGISMGIKGTDVAKEASSIVLADDNYVTIVSAVEEGRAIYANIRKFIKLMLSVNFSEVMLVAITSLMSMPLPLLPLQLLWINLVTDSFPALALAVDPVEKEIMKAPPRKKNESIFSGGLAQFLIAAAIVATIAYVVIFFWGIQFGIEKARTLALTLVVVYETIFLFNCRSETKPFFKVNPFSNIYLFVSVITVFVLQFAVLYIPPLQLIFKTIPLNLRDWGVIAALSALGVVVSPSFFLKRSHMNCGTSIPSK